MRRPEPENDDRKKRWKFGQNFLIDETVVRQIAEDVGPRKNDWVIEIGPGAGAITRRLAAECAKLTAIEIDPKWIEHLRKHPQWGNLDIVQADATRVDVEELLQREPGKKPLVVGNLPYNRAAPILFRFLPFIHRFQSMNIMVQYEVGKRICAKPHTRNFGFLSVFIQNHATAELLQKIGQDAFRPRPKVMSATVRLTPLAAPKISDPMFLRFVEIAFSQKRKKLSNSLMPFYRKEKVEEVLHALNDAAKDMGDGEETIVIGENSRAEDLSVDQFVEAFKLLGPPPGVLPRAIAPSMGLDDTIGDGDGSEEAEEAEEE
ncbi:MAG: dimethyladenosine transferase [Fibrobacteres bacterium]|nr:dimethyladenosine transferase [Fibrobacterota bacterium]